MKLFLISFISLLVDRLIKVIVTSSISFGERVVIIRDFFNLTYVTNDGAAFSILSGNTLLLIVLTIIALVLIVCFYLLDKSTSNKEKIVIALLIGGILGNLYDRVVYGHVIDYLEFNIFGYNFPIFNFADIVIVVSIFSLCILTFRKKDDNDGEIKSEQ